MTDLLSELEQHTQAITPGRWQAGLTGDKRGAHCNLVAWAGDDIVGVAHVPNERNAAYIVALANAAPAMIACVRAAKERVRLRKAVRAHAMGAGQLPHHNEIFAADDALDAALAQLEDRP